MAELLDPRTLDDLAHAIADDGLHRHEAQVAAIVASLRAARPVVAAAGRSALLIDIIDRRDAPAVVRERAFGELRVELARPRAVAPRVLGAAA